MAEQSGFFDLGSAIAAPLPTLANKKNSGGGCMDCGLYRKCRNGRMQVFGEGNAQIFILGEAPGEVEDAEGVPFVGPSGELLRETLEELGISLDEDCWCTNAVQCRPLDYKGRNRAPTTNEINQCRLRVLHQIDQLKPKVIIPLGIKAVQSLIVHRISGRLGKRTTETDFYGENIPDQEWQTWIAPTYHPAYLLHKRDDEGRIDPAILKIWRSHLKASIALANKTFPVIENSQDRVYTTTNPEQAIAWIESAMEFETVSVDYETSAIKPHRKGQKIVSAAISNGEEAWAFPFFLDHMKFREAWNRLMTAPGVGKIAHKLDFEGAWTYFRAILIPEDLAQIYDPPQYDIYPWAWDTLLGAHCLQNKKPTGQKFLTYCLFGIMNYDDEIDRYIVTTKDSQDLYGKNTFNRVDEAPIIPLLKYNGLDTLYCHWIYKIQAKRLTGRFLQGFLFLLEGANALSIIQHQGIPVATELMDDSWQKLSRRIEKYMEAVLGSDEVAKWPKYKRAFNPLSHLQIGELLYTILKHPLPNGVEKTDNKHLPVAEDALQRIDTEFTDNVLALRKYIKQRDTYLAQYQREQINGIMYPFFNLHIADTFRSSSDSPNFQNVIKRDLSAMKTIRSLIIPSRGNRLIEYDFKGMEVSVAACVFKDPNLIKEVSDPTADMHRDTAFDIMFRSPNDWDKSRKLDKAERQAAKNGYVFPTFFGSNAYQTARGVWEQLPKETIARIKDIGSYEDNRGKKIKITNLDDYTEFLKRYDHIFWDKRFRVYKEGRNAIYKQYRTQGYIDMVTGFRCQGPLDYTQVVNYPVQGPAFHILLWTLIHAQKEGIQRNCPRSAIIGQIHDAVVADVHPAEEKEFDRIINLCGTQKVREAWKWIIVPLTIEKERSEIDGNWANMTESEICC